MPEAGDRRVCLGMSADEGAMAASLGPKTQLILEDLLYGDAD